MPVQGLRLRDVLGLACFRAQEEEAAGAVAQSPTRTKSLETEMSHKNRDHCPHRNPSALNEPCSSYSGEQMKPKIRGHIPYTVDGEKLPLLQGPPVATDFVESSPEVGAPCSNKFAGRRRKISSIHVLLICTKAC